MDDLEKAILILYHETGYVDPELKVTTMFFTVSKPVLLNSRKRNPQMACVLCRGGLQRTVRR